MAATRTEQAAGRGEAASAYESWIQAQGIPIHRAFFIEDLRTIELGWWEFRQCQAAFLVLAGQEDIQESRVTAIAPGAALPPWKIALEEMCYCVQGQGMCTVWSGDMPRKQFEFQKHSLFMIPPSYTYQLSNSRGDQEVRLLHCNYLPLAMLIMPIPDFYFNNEFVDTSILYAEDESEAFSEAKQVERDNPGERGVRALWVGNFFPDMKAWDKLEAHRRRGAGGSVVDFRSRTGRGGHMSVFPVGTYKMAHRHGPGTVIVIPEGDGFSVLWPPGGDKEKTYVPWGEASVFVPPNQWFHQHFNTGSVPARYLAIARPGRVFDTDESLNDRQIAYTEEDPEIRQRFENELAKHSIQTRMPAEVYTNPNYQWKYRGDD
ncbi:MAG: cupin domain-containing protein [Chloroflexi bacterium]|nr:cupin domain-containing protein [Chloroflexota bacterium]